ncbi:MAG: ribosome assembly cofactor RimP [Flavobacteriaceae bacterium]|nr:ribosome assembly cofactor RimP [Flavobacteriaceae bacterium]
MEQKKVFDLLNEALEENTSLFLISATISVDNKIKVVVDGDEGVPLSECMRISRKIEHNLDREEEDFSLEVTTAGASEPLIMKRQYHKNIGRTLNVKLNDGSKIEGTLTEVLEDEIVLSWKAREPKPIGKGKVTVNKNATIAFEDIKEAKAKIIFN